MEALVAGWLPGTGNEHRLFMLPIQFGKAALFRRHNGKHENSQAHSVRLPVRRPRGTGDLDLDGYSDALITVRLANGGTAVRLLRNVACTDGTQCLQYVVGAG